MDENEMVRTILEHTEYLKKNNLPYEGFEIIQTKWCGRILLELCQKSPQRFGELRKAVPEISNVVLTSALKTLVGKGLVIRTQFNEIPPHVEYSLTDLGRSLKPILDAMQSWGEEYKAKNS